MSPAVDRRVVAAGANDATVRLLRGLLSADGGVVRKQCGQGTGFGHRDAAARLRADDSVDAGQAFGSVRQATERSRGGERAAP